MLEAVTKYKDVGALKSQVSYCIVANFVVLMKIYF